MSWSGTFRRKVPSIRLALSAGRNHHNTRRNVCTAITGFLLGVKYPRPPRTTAVSYTHLDVYKRQGYAFFKGIAIPLTQP